MRVGLKKYYILTLGCQMNKSDSERLAAVLEKAGYKKTEREHDADLITAVACSVRQSATDRVYGKINVWKNLPKKPITVLTGCVLPSDKKKLAEKFDVVLDISEIKALPAMIGRNPRKRGVDVSPAGAGWNYIHISPTPTSKFQAFVPISTGCDNFCTYCAVPFTRGRQVHRPAKEILREIDNLIQKGYREITLLGQMVNAYKNPEKNSGIKDFADLLDLAAKRAPGAWIWFTSPYPTLFTDKLIKVITQNKNIKRHLHLPIQSGSNNVLQQMNRKYTREQYLVIIKKIQNKIPDLSITTDVIVGFPNETKKDFAKTLDLYKKVQFDMAYTAQYSVRPGTAAANSPALKDNIPKAEKKKREKILTDLLKKIALEQNKKLLGKITEVLVEKCEGLVCFGKTFQGKNIKFDCQKNLTGNFAKIKVIKAETFRLKGNIQYSKLKA